MQENLKARLRAVLARRPNLLARVQRWLGHPCEFEVLRLLLRPGAVVLDVGANIGQFSVPIAHLVAPDGCVHAFEPTPRVFAKLEFNLRHLPRTRFVARRLAVSEHAGTAALFVPDERGLEASLARHHGFSAWSQAEDPACESIGVETVSIDDYLQAAAIPEVALMKIDVEGAELLVLRGARRLLASPRPPILIFESWGRWTRDFGYRPAELFDFLRDTARYRIFHFRGHDLSPVPTGNADEPGVFPRFVNFLALAEGVHAAEIATLKRAGLIPANV